MFLAAVLAIAVALAVAMALGVAVARAVAASLGVSLAVGGSMRTVAVAGTTAVAATLAVATILVVAVAVVISTSLAVAIAVNDLVRTFFPGANLRLDDPFLRNAPSLKLQTLLLQLLPKRSARSAHSFSNRSLARAMAKKRSSSDVLCKCNAGAT